MFQRNFYRSLHRQKILVSIIYSKMVTQTMTIQMYVKCIHVMYKKEKEKKKWTGKNVNNGERYLKVQESVLSLNFTVRLKFFSE